MLVTKREIGMEIIRQLSGLGMPLISADSLVKSIYDSTKHAREGIRHLRYSLSNYGITVELSGYDVICRKNGKNRK